VPTPSSDRSTVDVLLVLRYRKAVTYGHHVLLAALEEHATATRYRVAFGTDVPTTVDAIRQGLADSDRVLVLWSFFSPDAVALALELAQIRSCVDDPRVRHVAAGCTPPPSPSQPSTPAGTWPPSVRIGLAEGFRINVDMIFGMPGEEPSDVEQSLTLATELADLGARIHAHTFMPLPGTPWRDAAPGVVAPETMRIVDRLALTGGLYGHWQRQGEHAARLAAAARAYPRRRAVTPAPEPSPDSEAPTAG
jgi:hypothetical protein